MGKWIKEFQILMWFAGLVGASIIYVSSTYATKEYVDKSVETPKAVLEQVANDVRDIKNHLMTQQHKKEQ